ncbi:MAG: PIG-L family deacetylase [Propionibacteriales bacterium]|nr:PIG-L family deacetylase [Propionibacteriales bacterium]
MSRPDVEVTPASHALPKWRRALLTVATLAPMDLLDLSTGDVVLVLGAHPDDETFGVAGTIASLAASGVDVHVVSMSAGEAALDHVGVTVAHLAAQRRHELASACAVLGTASDTMRHYPDGRLAEFENGMAADIAAVAHRHGARRLLTVAWCEPHPDHAAVGRATLEAGARLGIPVTGYVVWALHWTDPDDPVMRKTPMTLMSLDARASAARHAAISCYRTQTEPLDAGVAAILPPSFVGNDLELLVG